MNLGEIIKELGRPCRIEVLEVLCCQPANLTKIHESLRKRGCNISISGLVRCLNKLVKLRIVEKIDDGCYCITGLGALIYDVLFRMDDLMNWKEIIEDALELMAILPTELKLGLSNLGKAETVWDQYAIVKMAFEAAINARRWGKYIDRLVDYEVFRLMIRNNLKGVDEKVISSTDTLQSRIETFIKALKDEGLDRDEIEYVKRKVEVRVLDLPFQLGVIDGEIALFQILKGDKIPPAFVSKDRDFVKWAEMIFDHFWKIAKPVRIPFERVLESF